MQRRDLLSTLPASAAVALAGCSGMLSSSAQDSSSRTPKSTTETPEPNPQASWSEEWVGGTNYGVTVTVQLDDADSVLVKEGTPNGKTVAEITSNGKHTIAGPGTESGSIKLGRTLYLVHPVEAELEGMDDRNKIVSSFLVGSQVKPSLPSHLRGVHGSTDPNLENSGTLSRTYEHKSNTGPAVLSLKIPKILYKYYKNRPRVRNYGSYVSDTYDDQYIQGIVDEFEKYGNERGMSDFEIINLMTQFVQSLKYTSDKVSAGYNEYPKYPIETLVDREGDCEDSCILLSSMVGQFGYGSALLIFREQQHMALGIAGGAGMPGTSFEHNGQHYYYTETTAKGWKIGEFPPSMKKTTPQFGPVNDSAVLVFSYAVDTPVEGGAVVEVTLKNVGDGSGPAQAKVSIENKSGEVVAKKKSKQVTLKPQEEYTTTLKLLPPDDQTLRVRVDALLDGSLQSSTKSDWQKPVTPDA